MIEYFPKATQEAIAHAKDEFPKESCGVIVDEVYYPCNNVHPNPEENFRISPQRYANLLKQGEVNAIIHSHNDYPHASKADMDEHFKTGVPYGIINLKNRSVGGVAYLGDQLPIQDLEGRPFFHGIYDCYALARDYYRNAGCEIPNFSRDVEWWNRGGNMFMENIDFTPFDVIEWSEILPGDGFLMNIRGSNINHCAVYLGRGLILHHLYGRLSRTEPLRPFKKDIRVCVRNKQYHELRLELQRQRDINSGASNDTSLW